MGIKKVKNLTGDRYVATVYLGNYQRVKRSFSSKKEAQYWAAEQRTLSKGGLETITRLHSRAPFGQIAADWFENKVLPQKSTKTIAEYRSILSKHLIPKYGGVYVQHIFSGHADSLIQTCKVKELAPKTINKILMVFKQVMKFAEQHKYVIKNQLAGYPELKVQKRKDEFLATAEIKQLLRANRNELIYPMLILALNTGMRLGEILGLCWDRVDFNTNFITVSRTLSRTELQETTKTHLIRHIPMNDEVLNLMRELVKKQRSLRFVFSKIDGSCWNPDHFGSREFKKALEKSGVRRIRFHDLRHTYASQYMMSGGDIYDLQRILGHSKIEMTQRYAHLSPNYLAKQVNLIRFNGDEDEALIGPLIAYVGNSN